MADPESNLNIYAPPSSTGTTPMPGTGTATTGVNPGAGYTTGGSGSLLGGAYQGVPNYYGITSPTTGRISYVVNTADKGGYNPNFASGVVTTEPGTRPDGIGTFLPVKDSMWSGSGPRYDYTTNNGSTVSLKAPLPYSNAPKPIATAGLRPDSIGANPSPLPDLSQIPPTITKRSGNPITGYRTSIVPNPAYEQAKALIEADQAARVSAISSAASNPGRVDAFDSGFSLDAAARQAAIQAEIKSMEDARLKQEAEAADAAAIEVAKAAAGASSSPATGSGAIYNPTSPSVPGPDNSEGYNTTLTPNVNLNLSSGGNSPLQPGVDYAGLDEVGGFNDTNTPPLDPTLETPPTTAGNLLGDSGGILGTGVTLGQLATGGLLAASTLTGGLTPKDPELKTNTVSNYTPEQQALLNSLIGTTQAGLQNPWNLTTEQTNERNFYNNYDTWAENFKSIYDDPNTAANQQILNSAYAPSTQSYKDPTNYVSNVDFSPRQDYTDRQNYINNIRYNSSVDYSPRQDYTDLQNYAQTQDFNLQDLNQSGFDSQMAQRMKVINQNWENYLKPQLEAGYAGPGYYGTARAEGLRKSLQDNYGGAATQALNEAAQLNQMRLNEGTALRGQQLNNGQALRLAGLTAGENINMARINQGQALDASRVAQDANLANLGYQNAQALRLAGLNEGANINMARINQGVGLDTQRYNNAAAYGLAGLSANENLNMARANSLSGLLNESIKNKNSNASGYAAALAAKPQMMQSASALTNPMNDPNRQMALKLLGLDAQTTVGGTTQGSPGILGTLATGIAAGAGNKIVDSLFGGQ